jgi:hypothetical protein
LSDFAPAFFRSKLWFAPIPLRGVNNVKSVVKRHIYLCGFIVPLFCSLPIPHEHANNNIRSH